MGLKLKGVGFTYLPGTPMAREVLKDIDLTLGRGEILCVMGATGAGKSTLLQVMGGLLTPTAGEILLEGRVVSGARRGGRALLDAAGILMQNPEKQLFAETVEKDVSFGPRNQRVSGDELSRLAREALGAVGLEPESFSYRHPFSLSEGEMRRVALAGVLARRPRFLLLDEPSSGLDRAGRDILESILREQRGEGKGVLLVTHDWKEVERLADRVLLLREGRVAASGSTDEILSSVEGLRQAGLGPPPLLEVLHQLRQRGLDLPAYASSARETATLIAAAMRGVER
jgi:energy-coupling factor transport system ATP-binding protein